MSTDSLLPPVAIRGRYRRSVDLARDVHEAHALDGYVVTATARATLARLVRGIAEPDAARAWSVIGPYGGGKSAFALFAARLAEGRADALALLAAADPDLARQAAAAFATPLAAVLVGGSREGLPRALARGLADAAHAGAFADALTPVRADALALLARLDGPAIVPDDDVLALFERAAAAVHAAAGGGLLLVVDEMGKLLEHAALDPAGSDLFLLQRLAERAARGGPGEAGRAPILVVTVLHQAFERYAGRLSQEQREEWRKVQGRFEDVPYAEPASETLRLLAQAVTRDPAVRVAGDAHATVDGVLAAVRLPAAVDVADARVHLLAALPLHPAVALLVGPLFRRMAQNERTLFAFLASGEPGGFLDVVLGGGAEPPAEAGTRPARTRPLRLSPSLRGTVHGVPEPGRAMHVGNGGFHSGGASAALPLYRLDHLFDYLTSALGASLAHGDAGRLWAETQAALHRLPDADALQTRLLKSIALLNFAGDLAGVVPTPALLAASAGASGADVARALAALVAARVATHQKHLDAYRVWQGSDFDLDARLAAARAALPPAEPLADMLGRSLPPNPVVARRHSYTTGTTRAFRVVYATEDGWRAEVRRFLADAAREEDGLVVYVVPEHADPNAVVDTLTADLGQVAAGVPVFAAVPYGVGALRESVRESLALDRLHGETEAELGGDRAGRLELEGRRAAVAQRVREGFARIIEPDATGAIPCSWVGPAGALHRLTGRMLQAELSRACDDLYPHAPTVWNELVNRRRPSASAASGLKALLVAMLDASDRPDLGFVGYPAAFGLYASILEANGMHREENGVWRIGPPDAAHAGTLAVWTHIRTRLDAGAGRAVAMGDLYAELQAPPFGMKAGLCPVFVVAFLKHHEREAAVFYEGRFIPALALAEVELLLRVPDKFAVQWIAPSDAKARVAQAVAALAGVAETVREPLPIVAGLIRAARALPTYTQTTGRLADRTLAVREALRQATEPATLLFETLPLAVGLGSFLTDDASAETADAFGERMRTAWDDLGAAYDALLADLEADLADCLHVSGPDAATRRRDLAERARPLVALATHPPLKAFLGRAADARLDARGWMESLGTLLGRRPPVMWVDADRETYAATLRDVARRFHTLEPLAFDRRSGDAAPAGGDGSAAEGLRLRVGVTSLHEAGCVAWN